MAQRFFGNILVGIESPQERRQLALKRAAQLAHTTGARLTLVHIAFDPYASGKNLYGLTLGSGTAKTLAQRRAALEKLAAPLRRHGLKVKTEAVWDDPPYDGIVRAALRLKPDLVVVESRRHAFGARLFLTNTDWQLIRLCPTPLLIVKHARPYGKTRVLAAVDPLHTHAKPARLDRSILEIAQALATAHSGRLDVVHTWLPPSRLMVDFYSGTTVDPILDQRYKQYVRKTLDRTVAPFDLPSAQVHLAIGDPSAALPTLARRLRTDVIVMGAVSRRGLKRVFIGNTAERIIDAAPCDVMVIKPRRFKTPVPRRFKPVQVMLPPV